jgi:hypothetical protein
MLAEDQFLKRQAQKHILQIPKCKACGQQKVVHIRTRLCSSCEEKFGLPAATVPPNFYEGVWRSFTPGIPASVIRELAGHGVTENDLREYRQNPVADADRAVADYVPEGQGELSENLLRHLKGQVIEAACTARGIPAHWEMSTEWAAETQQFKPSASRNTAYLFGYPVTVGQEHGVPELVPDPVPGSGRGGSSDLGTDRPFKSRTIMPGSAHWQEQKQREEQSARVQGGGKAYAYSFFEERRQAAKRKLERKLEWQKAQQEEIDQAVELINDMIKNLQGLPPNRTGKEKQ